MRSVSILLISPFFILIGGTALAGESDANEMASMEIDDPRVHRAEKVRDTLALQEKILVANLESLLEATERSVRQLDPTTLENVQTSLEGFRGLSRQLHGSCEDLLLYYDIYKRSLSKYTFFVTKGHPYFYEAANAAREWAKEEQFEEIKEDYLRIADVWDNLGDGLKKRVGSLAVEESQLADTIQYMKATRLFLKRFHAHLSTLPSLEAVENRERYLKRLENHIKNFEKFRGLFREFHGRLVDSAFDDHDRSHPNDTLATASAASDDDNNAAQIPNHPVRPVLGGGLLPLVLVAPAAIYAACSRRRRRPRKTAEVPVITTTKHHDRLPHGETDGGIRRTTPLRLAPIAPDLVARHYKNEGVSHVENTSDK